MKNKNGLVKEDKHKWVKYDEDSDRMKSGHLLNGKNPNQNN